MYVSRNYVTKSTILSSFLLALFADIKSINSIFTSLGFSEDSSIMSILYIFIVSVISIISFINSKRFFSHIDKFYFITVSYILISYQFSNTFLGTPYTKLNHLLVFTIVALFIPYIVEINVKYCLKIIMLLPIIGLPFLNKIFVFVNEYLEWVSMGVSYAFMPPILANIIYMFAYYKTENKIQKSISIITTLSNIVYLYYLFQFGSRGPFVCILGLCIFLSLIKKQEDFHVVINKSQLFVFIILGLIGILCFIPILKFCSELLSSIGINSHMVDKLILLDSGGNLSNGRDVIIDVTFRGIFDYPIFGNGFDQFCNNTGYVYPHNAILQIIYDGGLFLFFILIFPVLKRIRYRFNTCCNDEFYLLAFFLFAGIPGSMFSGDAWRQPLLWMFVGLVMSKTSVKD